MYLGALFPKSLVIYSEYYFPTYYIVMYLGASFLYILGIYFGYCAPIYFSHVLVFGTDVPVYFGHVFVLPFTHIFEELHAYK